VHLVRYGAWKSASEALRRSSISWVDGPVFGAARGGSLRSVSPAGEASAHDRRTVVAATRYAMGRCYGGSV
jgi:hypothetical protein